MSESFRTEHDTMGEVRVPADALYGAQTQRAVENFPISRMRFGRAFLSALGLVKFAAARANRQAGTLLPAIAVAIETAAQEVMDGRYDSQFVVDVFQTGSGTSTNMNANEVIATRASAILAQPVHPNDHVNRSQSSNDVIPDGDPHRRGANRERNACCPRWMRFGCRSMPNGSEFWDDSQDRPDASAGRRSHASGAGVRRLRAAGGTSQARIRQALEGIYELPLGGTAVGPG